jgi:hypothetical protein
MKWTNEEMAASMKTNMIIALGMIMILVGCGVTLSPNKRKPLEVTPVTVELPRHSQTILVRFRETLPGKPLNETVWDNVSGPIWDVRESKQIGFTQNYANLVALGVVSGVAGGAVGAGAAGAMAPQVVDTRILIPFGRLFGGVFQSALSKSFSRATICFEPSCTSIPDKTDYVMAVKVTEMKVWEGPMNHINLTASVTSEISMPGHDDTAPITYVTKKDLLGQSLGSVFTTSSGFIRAMNRIANAFSADIAVDLIENGIK